MNISAEQQSELMSKRENLSRIAETLKQEFFGIDNIIDDVMQSIESWYFFPQYQTKPLIVNLWGMTGTGKTSLVRRLSELLENDYFVHIDMGEQIDGSSWRTLQRFENGMERLDSKVSIICLDEFQLCRTLTDNYDEIDRASTRTYWELIDTGFVNTGESFANHIYEISILTKILKKCLLNRVVVKNGRIVEGKEIYTNIYNHAMDFHSGKGLRIDNEETTYFIPADYKAQLYEIYEDVYPDYELFEKHLLSLDGHGSLELLNQAILRGNSIKNLDLRKSLIFVVGNLDEVFFMYDEINPDIDPDVFYQYSLKISTTDIKQGLSKRFRSEQIARFGNNHIIYPALSKSAYETLIQSELNKLSERFKEQTDAELIFAPSINDMIYKEGVFPSQGARPVFTSIKLQLESYFGKIINHAFITNPCTDKIIWAFEDNKHIIKMYENETELGTLEFKAELKVESLRKSTQDDKQAVIAVHEAGHAIATAMSSRILPKKIVSVSPMGNVGGSTFMDWPEHLSNRENTRHRIIGALSGYLAEKLLFGDSRITNGSENDLELATKMTNMAIKKQGFGSTLRSTDIESMKTNMLFKSNSLINVEAENFLAQCEKEAMDILKRNKKLLIEMAKYLTENSKMTQDKIEQYIKKYSVDDWVRTEGFVNAENYYNYKELLFGME